MFDHGNETRDIVESAEDYTISQENQRKVMQGAHDMLTEAAKQFRLNDDQGHATMCELHVDQLFDVLSLLPATN